MHLEGALGGANRVLEADYEHVPCMGEAGVGHCYDVRSLYIRGEQSSHDWDGSHWWIGA